MGVCSAFEDGRWVRKHAPTDMPKYTVAGHFNAATGRPGHAWAISQNQLHGSSSHVDCHHRHLQPPEPLEHSQKGVRRQRCAELLPLLERCCA